MTEQETTAGLSRRSVLLGAATVALGAAFVKGADISWMPQMEANGYCWNNKSGQRQDLFTILKGYGITAVSLRTWVNPSNDPVNGHCGTTETAWPAARCRDAGLQVLLGLTPGWVKIGNETDSGICRPVGSVGNPGQMTGLLNAAYDASKRVFPTTPVMVHIAQPQKWDSIAAFLNAYRANGGRWDITGLSSYAQGSNIPGVLTNMKNIQSTWGKPVMQVEYGGPLSKPTQVLSSYDMSAWDPSSRRPTAALDGFLTT